MLSGQSDDFSKMRGTGLPVRGGGVCECYNGTRIPRCLAFLQGTELLMNGCIEKAWLSIY